MQMRCWSQLFVRRAPLMGPGVPREAQRLVCVCTNEFAQTLPSALRYFVADASAPYRTARESSCSPTMRRGGIAANLAKLPELLRQHNSLTRDYVRHRGIRNHRVVWRKPNAAYL